MLRSDNSADLVRMPLTIGGLLSGRYAVRSGRRIFPARFRRRTINDVYRRQDAEPIALVADGRRILWYFRDRFYWDDDDDLSASDVAALVFQREQRRRRRLDSAHSLLRAQTAGQATRAPIPVELRRAVYERDGGCCSQCGATFDLQYDHVLPVALGGATTLANLQLLCSDCNRQKGDSL